MRLWAVCVLLLAGCNGEDKPPPAPPPLPASVSFSVDATQWMIQYSPGMPSNPSPADGGGWYFDFPAGPQEPGAPSVHYVVTASGGALNSSVLGMEFEIVEANGPVTYQYKFAPDNTCDSPASLRLFLQQVGDDLTPSHQYYRWWSIEGYQLKAGVGALSAPLNDPSKWSSVLGVHGDANPAGFAAAKANLASIGFTFGGGCFYGHGVNIAGGSSRFVLRSLVAR